MKPTILYAKNTNVMDELTEIFLDSKYKIKSEEDNYVLLRKTNYGNIIIHILFLLVALFLNSYAIIINLIYFCYNFFKKSNIILITTDTLDTEGNPVEFDNVEDLEVFYDQELWDKAIELSKRD